MPNQIKIHPLAWFLILGTGLSRAALFLTLPFLTIHIGKTLNTSTAVSGFIVGLGPLAGMFGAFVMGSLSDRVGRKKILHYSLLCWSLAFVGLYFAYSLWHFALLQMLYGFSRASFESVASATLTDITTVDNRKRVFHYRYYAINVGACIGPPLGAWFMLSNSKINFLITGAVYFLYFLLIKPRLHLLQDHRSLEGEKLSFKKVVFVLRKDSALPFVILGQLLMIAGFSQLETTIPEHLSRSMGKLGVQLYAYLTFTNAITVILLQFPLAKLTQRWQVPRLMTLGYIVFGIGLASFAVFENSYYWMLLSMFILTIGEIFAFSNFAVLIDQISPAKMKGSYFGAMEWVHLGFFIGPPVGGLIFENSSSIHLYLFFSALTLVSILLFKKGTKTMKTSLLASGH